MKIAMVSEHASPLAVLGGVDAGGQNVHVDALARGLAARGHEVVVYTRRDNPDLAQRVEIVPGMAVHHIDAGPAEPVPKDEFGPFLARFAQELTKQWEIDRPDVIHAHFWMSGVISLEGAELLDIPTAMTYHALGVVKKRHQAEADTSPDTRIPAERQLLTRMSRIIATCTDEVRELVEMGGDEKRMDIVPCGVDSTAFCPAEVGESDVVATERQERHRILSLSRLVPRKGVGEVIEMLAYLDDVELTVAGGPEPQALDSDAEVARLRRLADEHGVADRVTFVGAVGRDRIPQLLAEMDLAVVLPWYEPFGIVPLEIMSCGKPLVGSAVGGLLDTVSDGETGLLVPPRNPRRAATAVRTLLDDAALRRSMGKAARRKIEEQYDWRRVCEATEAVYRDMLTSHSTVAVRTSA
ncbi:MAG: glycosyltransferase [Candidatus Nanopelagicales bacterium]